MIGTGPAAQAAAYHSAGVPLRRIGRALGLPGGMAGRLVLGIWLHDSRAAGLSLTDHDDDRCMVDGCERVRAKHRLCWAHLSRFYAGIPAVGRPTPAPAVLRLRECAVCGVRWCALTSQRRVTCGDKRCLAELRQSPQRRGRDAEILARVKAGEPYAAIAADYQLTDRRVSQMANRAGLYRREPRGSVQRAAREATTAAGAAR